MYDKFPAVQVSADASLCLSGWEEIGAALLQSVGERPREICVECYPGVFAEELHQRLVALLRPSAVLATEELLRPEAELESTLAPRLTDDPVFGILSRIEMEEFFDSEKVCAARRGIEVRSKQTTLIIGPGASLIAPLNSLLVYADLARWEIQQRQRRGLIGNLGANNRGASPALQYKRAFFVDWRAADRLKHRLLPHIDFLLDTHHATPKMITGDLFRHGLKIAAQRPFRVVPFFDPGPWGGHWMERVCDLPRNRPNYAWCFDCVPEENSLLLGFGNRRVEIPAVDLVFSRPEELLGAAVYEHFGAEFPIRFDFLDTMGGGNLSLQVHPLAQYARERFGLSYTQDESYYLLDADDGACVYLGLKEGIDPQAMREALETAKAGGAPFDAERFVNRWPVKKHDHFSIPAGTVHCSGRNSMVLEISATPYIFTFKLWDWARMGLDRKPRPIHLEHGLQNIQWDRTTAWVKASLVGQVEKLATGDGWREERTGLHELEFIETRRHWFTSTVLHDTMGTVNVLSLVQGAEALVQSADGAFEPFVVHYAETFIVPASVGCFTIRPHGPALGKEFATIKAFVRRELLKHSTEGYGIAERCAGPSVKTGSMGEGPGKA